MRFVYKLLLSVSVLLMFNITLADNESKQVVHSNNIPATTDKIIRIAAGDLLDGYYMIGLKLCKYISNSNNGIRCEVIPTSGSQQNLQLLHEGKVDFAFSIANLALDAYEGRGMFADQEPFKDLRQVLNLHEVYFTVLSKDQDQILTFKDLDNRKISNGPAGSDSTAVYNEIFKLYDFAYAPVDVEILYENYAKKYCNGEVDALMILTGHPNVLINLITNQCESDFVSMDPKKLDIFIKKYPMFYKTILKKGIYPGITEDQETVAVRAIFVVNKNLDTQIMRNFIDYTSIRFEQLKLSDEVLNELNVKDFTKGFVIPGYFDNRYAQ
ncbi:MAG: TAXI family TRAP transporter solute-binding subunit [Rickettsiaceae bacterium]|nr:TAXI family TRAP transporter solute-binding subunit [Rickettsiaceae bacterium]